ncbi:unnamed protein product [Ceratitis capitata]|uniref:(Mediterranean fruit fly) hypothetical protein n=1 Tax=Ceratitis capitata TaxID=7213 RepID=A0A811UL17_CERCA|nr:unnamed protein product [Ceratitis capitata]
MVIQTFCAVSGDYGAHYRETIGKVFNKFRATGMPADIVRLVHHRFDRSTSNMATVGESEAEDPKLRMCRFLKVFKRWGFFTLHFDVFCTWTDTYIPTKSSSHNN